MPKAPITNIIFGTMTLGYRGYGARVHDAATANAMLGTVSEFGHDQIDTCSDYGDGSCEQMLGDLRAAERFGIATRIHPGNFHGHEPENYLWAHRNEYIQVAQELVNVLPGAAVIDILRYLVEDFWARRTGWPDLLVYRSNEYFFAEVKTARSRLGQNKERWICDCRKRFHLPFKLVEVRKAGCSSSSPNHVPTPWGAA